jgi:CHASE3 domain sensor protein
MFRTRKLIDDGISLKSLYLWVVFIAVLFTVLVAYSTVNLSKSFRVLSSSVEEHKFLETSAIKMIDGSDYLTERVQRYAVTGEADYVSDYLTEALQTQRREQAIRDLTRDPRCSTALELLNLAMAASQHLMEREYYAMKLVASAKIRKIFSIPFPVSPFSLNIRNFLQMKRSDWRRPMYLITVTTGKRISSVNT